MSRRVIQPDGVATPKAPYAPVAIVGDMVYTAGQTGVDASGAVVDGGIEAQTRRALENIRLCLEAAGCSLGDVVKVNAYLTNLDDFPVYNDVYREFFDEPYPARTTVGASLASGLLVEIDAVARRNATAP